MSDFTHHTLELRIENSAVDRALGQEGMPGVEILAAMLDVELRQAATSLLAEILIRHGVELGRFEPLEIAELVLRDARARSRGR